MLIYKSESWANSRRQSEKSWRWQTVPNVWATDFDCEHASSEFSTHTSNDGCTSRSQAQRSCFESVMQKAMRSTTYDGHHTVETGCMKTASLNWLRNFTDNQWSSQIAKVMCDRWSRGWTRRATAFSTRWSGSMVDAGRPARTTFQQSRRLHTGNVAGCLIVSWLTLSWSCRNLRRWKDS